MLCAHKKQNPALGSRALKVGKSVGWPKLVDVSVLFIFFV